LQDFLFAARALAHRPGFALVAIFTLALGIGATTLIFSVADAVLLRPLPYQEPERLVMVGAEYGAGGRLSPTSPADFLDLRDRSTSLRDVAASASATFDLVGEGTPRRFNGARVSADFFRVLGIEPVAGRTFRRDEEIPGNDRVAVISHRAWQDGFAADPAVVGRSVTMNRAPYTIVGVMPADFHPPEGIRYQPAVDVWVPLAFDPERVDRRASHLWAIGRLADGVSLEGAAAELDALTAAFRREFYDGDERFGFRIEPLLRRTVGTIGDSIGLLAGAVALLLVIACANVANLSLARGSDRSQEIAVRAALGAGRGRVMRQLLFESILLALCGGAAGSLIAYAGVALLPRVNPGDLPRAAEVVLDLRVLAFASALSLLTGLVFGIAPALRLSHAELGEVLKSRAAQSGRRSDPLRGTLVAAQTALALVLLVGAGLLINSFVRLRNVRPGFEPGNLMIMRLYMPPELPGGSRWDPANDAEWEGWRTFYGELLDSVAALPGVSAAAGTTAPPITGPEIWLSINIEGQPPAPEAEPVIQADNRVTPGYFETIGAALIRGREFTRADDSGPAHAIVNEAFAQRHWPGEDPIGKRFQYGSQPDPDNDYMTVIGVVENTMQAALGSEPQPEFFVPFFQNPLRANTVVARFEGDGRALATAMREAVWALRPDLPVSVVEPMRDTMAGSIVEQRFYMLLLAAFGVVAVVLAAVGIYGTTACAVAQRTREVGVRMALGARPADALRLVMGSGMTMTAIGIVLGIAGALALSRFIEGFVFGITPTDPATFAAVALLLTLVAALACWLPARRAANLDPAETLRAG
jgi:putative ABC transport system permease protein